MNAKIFSDSKLTNGTIKDFVITNNSATFTASKISSSTSIDALKDGTAKIIGKFRGDTINTEVPVYANIGYYDYKSDKLIRIKMLINTYYFYFTFEDTLTAKTYENFKTVEEIYNKNDTNISGRDTSKLVITKFYIDTLIDKIDFKYEINPMAITWDNENNTDTLSIIMNILKE